MSKVAISQVAGRITGIGLALVVGFIASPPAVHADDGPPDPPDKADNRPADRTRAQPTKQSPAANPSPGADPLVLTRLVPSEPDATEKIVTVAANGATFVLFPASVKITNRKDIESVVSHIATRNWLFLSAATGAKPGTTATVELTADGYAPASMPVRIQSGATGGNDPYAMLPRSEVETRRARFEDLVDTRVAAARLEMEAEHEREIERREHRASHKATVRTVARLDGPRYYAHGVTKLDPDSPVLMVTGGGDWINEEFILPVSIATIGDRPIRAGGIVVTGSDGKRYHPEFDFYNVDDAGDDWFATINLERPVDGAIALKPPTDGGPMVPFTIELIGTDGKRVQGVKVEGITRPEDDRERFPWVELAQLEREARDRKEAERRREAEARRVSLHITGSYGAILFPSGVTGIDGTETASLRGLGVRMTKGLLPLIAFEVEIGGATSGVATFDDVTVEGTMGDLTRSAKLARVSLGGVLRFGDKIVPHARLGVGLQLVDEVTMLQTGGGPVEMDGSGLAFGGSVYGGAGVDVKLGSNLVAGLGLTFTAAQSDQRMLDFGLSVAYRWDPSSD